MSRYIWHSIRTYKNRSFLFIIALATIFVILPLSLLTTFQVQVEIDEQIKNHARGSYDILIRPEGARSEVEREFGLVEENYLGVGDGGITLDQWEEIKALPDVEVAAPIASLGYFNGGVKSLEYALPESSRWMEVDYETTDGIHHYPLSLKQAYYLLEQQGFYKGFESIKDAEDPLTGMDGHEPLFTFPVSYHLTVGVDLAEEEKLTGFDLSSLNKEIDEGFLRSFGYMDQEQIRPIPVIYLDDARIPIHVSVSSQELKWSTEDTLSLKEQLGLTPDAPIFFPSEEDSPVELEVLNKLENLKNRMTSPISHQVFDLSNALLPFQERSLRLNDDGGLGEAQTEFENSLYTSNFYQVTPIRYDINEGKLSVKKIGQEAGIPVYRDIQAEQNNEKNIQDIPFIIRPVGTFTTEKYQAALSASPLGIYQQAPVTLEDNRVLQETILPGSFVSAPAHGLMRMEDAAYIKGESPIDAVRVRVGGIAQYDDLAEAKILEVVKKIQEIGFFEIDIVAGSSPIPVTVFVEGIGEVTQPWTSLGIAAKITEGWNITNIMIVSLFSTVCLGYLFNRFLFRRWLQHEEKMLLLELGWKQQHIRRFYFGEYAFLLLFSILLASIILYALVILGVTDFTVYLLLLAVIPFVVMLILVNLFQGKRPSLPQKRHVKGASLLLQNILYYKRFIIITFLQLAAVMVAVILIGLSILTTIEETEMSSLGKYVNDEIMISLILILIASFVMAIITVLESTSSFLTIRQKEIELLHDIGWRQNHVLHLYLKEVSIWSMIALVSGAMIGIVIASIVYTLTVPLLLAALGFLLSFVGIVTLLTYVTIRKHLMQHGGIGEYFSL